MLNFSKKRIHIHINVCMHGQGMFFNKIAFKTLFKLNKNDTYKFLIKNLLLKF